MRRCCWPATPLAIARTQKELVSAAIDTAQQLGMKVLLEHALALKLKIQGRELP